MHFKFLSIAISKKNKSLKLKKLKMKWHVLHKMKNDQPSFISTCAQMFHNNVNVNPPVYRLHTVIEVASTVVHHSDM